MQITRDVGDNYPIDIVIKVNGVVVDITGSTFTFTYKTASEEKTISGVISDALNGKVRFSPTITDFNEVGSFNYKIKRVSSGITATHLKGQITIE